MIGHNFRPWGKLEWLLGYLPKVKWDLINCISTEDRFHVTLSQLEKNKALSKALAFKIIDPPSKDSEEISKILEKHELLLKGLTNKNLYVEEHNLLEPYGKIIESIDGFMNESTGNVVIDISTLPKRFFFPIVKRILKKEPRNLVITYTSPEQYNKEELSGNPQSWDHLPLFMPVQHPRPEHECDLAIVGIGFMPFSLPELLLSNYSATPVKFLFPFPPGPPNYQRTWDFVEKIEKSFSFKPSDKIIRLYSNNLPDAFNHIVKETDNGDKRPIFAPYGPKPVSLAMCLYAVMKECSVYYTQPTHYSLNYSSGFKTSFGYSIILNGKNLYSID